MKASVLSMVKTHQKNDSTSGVCRSNGDELPASSNFKPKRTEILLVYAILIVISLFALLDISEDLSFHTPLSHIITDASLTILAIFFLLVLLYRTRFVHWRTTNLYATLSESMKEVERSKSAAEQSKQQADHARKFAEHYKQQAHQSKQLAEELKVEAEQTLEDKRLLLKGLGQIIDTQIEKWKLSAAEKEIALFLLKGLSHAEIAEIRKTSERTVRQQSLKIYAKAGLSGRSDLAAYFIEDMLAPLEPRGESLT
ncbi:MAG: LuxR C-terminal-related transcriptional regulator [Bdellovibrionales bacterium]